MTDVRSPAEIWKTAHGELRLQMTRAAFDTWLRDAHLVAEENGVYVIGVPNVYARDWLEHRLQRVIFRTLKQIAGYHIDVEFTVHSEHTNDVSDLRQAGPLLANLEPSPSKRPPAKTRADQPNMEGLNPRYTFDDFVEGPCNRLARAVALSAAENPGQLVNPLVICCDVGLGKSHLLHAIGHHARSQALNVVCVSAETFTNDLVEAIRKHTTSQVREKYRSADVLLMDDIQFLAGKDSTQEEFFHTFNTLYDQGKQIVLAADHPPGHLKGLNARLRSRLEGGMVADLKPPTFETRVEILRHRARRQQVVLPEAILEYVAGYTKANIRQLEGAFTRVLTHADLTGKAPTLSSAQEALGDLAPPKLNLTLDHVIDTVAAFYRIDADAIRGRDRSRVVSAARQIVMYLAHELAELSLPQIGQGLSGRNHSTVLYSCNRVEEELASDQLLRTHLTLIREALEEDNTPPTYVQ